MDQDRQFSFKKAFAIQANQIRRWRRVLKPSVTRALIAEARARNNMSFLRNPYDVFRGDDISEFIQNYSYRR